MAHPVFDESYDTSISAFSDDILQFHARARPTAARSAAQFRRASDALDDALTPAGYSQNRGKQEVAPCLGSAQQARL
eukprot:2165683-Pyramimonas_sp.AAC.1